MKKSPSLTARLLAKMQKLGFPERKAKELAKGLAPTAQRAAVTGTVTGKLEAKLVKLGLTTRKAKELAKGLAPLVRASIKAKVKQKAITLDDVDDDLVNTTVAEETDKAEDVDLDTVAPRVNGHRVRLDLSVAPFQGLKGIELLRVMDGLSSYRTYLVAAVKGEDGIVAIRKLGENYYNVKFYPTFQYWNQTSEALRSFEATESLTREWYERMHFTKHGVERLLAELTKKAKPKISQLAKRYLTVSGQTVLKAFAYLGRAAAA